MQLRLLPLSLLALGTLAHPASATVVTCEALGAPGVVISLCSNHGYLASSTPIALRHASLGLSLLRDRLVRKGSIDDLPVLVETSAITGDRPLALARRADCTVDYGETERESTPIGECYQLTTNTNDPSFSQLRAMLIATATLTPAAPERSFGSAAELAKLPLPASREFRGLEFDDHPLASPDGVHSVTQRWRDGEIALVLFRGSQQLRTLPRIPGYLAQQPRWSPDGKRLLYATLSHVFVFHLPSGRTKELTLARLIPSTNPYNDVRAEFGSNDVIEVSADTEFWSGYQTRRVDLAGVKTTEQPPQR